MIKILKYLITIRFRTLFAKDDHLANGLFVLGIAVLTYFFQFKAQEYINYLGLFSLQIVVMHFNRKDVEFLKLNSNFRFILFLEYCILSSPVLILLLYNDKIGYCVGFLMILIGITFLKKMNVKVIQLPFKMFDPFWAISFRKYKLFLVIPVLIFISYMGFKFKNANLYYAALIVAAIILCSPSFEREKISFIKASSFIGKHYLLEQMKTIIYNSFLVVILPLAFVFLVIKQWELLFLLPFLVLLPIVNLLLKYVFFDRTLTHGLFFGLFVGNIMFGFPLLFIPLLYVKSIQKLKKIQNA